MSQIPELPPSKSLQTLPTEVLINIFSHLDEKDFYSLQETCKHFEHIINDEELWKNLFVSRIHTNLFPSFSRSNKYSIEYVERNKGLNQWRHNRAIKTKYTITTQNMENQLEKVVFDYPRCACYNEGVITLVQLHSRRRKDRLTYIPCTTPQGCSTMHFNINAAVFGRYDGRVFGKLLTNKSYLYPVTEFDSMHRGCVTAITTAALEDSSKDWCVSGCETGQVIWWCETKRKQLIQLSNSPILHLSLYKDLTVAMDASKIYLVEKMKQVFTLDIPQEFKQYPNQIQFFKVDFGAKLLVLGDVSQIQVISINIHKDFGHTRSIDFPEMIQEVFIDETTTRREQDSSIAGDDGCYLGVLTRDNSVMTINIRTPGSELHLQTKLTFQDQVFTCQVNNLVLVCAFSGTLGVFDASNGTELRVVQKMEKYPQFLNISNGHMILGSGNVLHYLQYASDDTASKKSGGTQRNRSNKWNETLNSQLYMYDEDEKLRREKEEQSEKLRKKFVGDLDDEEIQLQIALMESEAAANAMSSASVASPSTIDDELLLAIEESKRANAQTADFSSTTNISDEGLEFLTAVEQSVEEKLQRKETSKKVSSKRSVPLGELQHVREPLYHQEEASDSELDEETKLQIQMMELQEQRRFENGQSVASNSQEHDEELELAIALSLSEIN